ncbi:MAG: gamma-glutamyl-gamma-aminobutyrate hydrolase family protein [Clostridiaceae bacterium]|nr:gamma-glutamyl-gamma-aminobutyrate hydrolase family protein [Clostridiaceae bacterium]
MLDKKPLIGITAGFDYSENKLYINSGYYEGIINAGGLPVVLPVTRNIDCYNSLIMEFDGFLLSGGPDVDAKHWHDKNYVFNGEISPYRDELEIFIVREAIKRNKPVFGICRGAQVINIALGGTIYQDIYSQINNDNLEKHSQQAPKWYPTHNIHIEKWSRIYKSHAKDTIRVNSFHHQAVKDLAPGFKVSSRCEDGVVESIEHETCTFAVGVQWHPELMWERDRTFLKLFEDFVECCNNCTSN